MAKAVKRVTKVSKSSRTKQKAVISQSQRKKTKFKVEKMNKEHDTVSLSAGEMNKALKGSPEKGTKNSILHKRDLLEGREKDRAITEQLDKNKKAADDSLLKQIEMMSGFSL
ncbi:similar to Saccharomyces cerevisiae YCL058W-A ADF1 Transcriptional repressor encoded by the antisense strand of the FYV5 gene [Maudiozyma barnettii]|uniref:Similar to Saccharomyces cerevisiae YCL058W-A ADF1 Transcriptional repressor encoded by the antisense strand of the FYV5 protein n=1 Tax=Maudiozyma barnettii TaxID=61262 RepID=A0A8H2VDL8_9SACH|nr:Adf1p [Kazachstania barnettii]CAB4253353.1 similar to Saccharomyces cerevisiae YCL058W-A ADF1 Transcriptional repressor encoded by the antisense strand of the FYV5 gene [Kazachstania barnettii]CAD1780898.1 similar to Saccharomyces cerevisiae YCL058W-A ADF1 Transcriptional repressor encoded by the antisense strand of the FYV5 gene [Kazachstania barnettii]